MQKKQYKFLDADTERELIKHFQATGDHDACSRLIESQTALAKRLIVRYAKRNAITISDDLIAEAPLAVFDAIRRFDLSRGVRLASAVGWAVMSRMSAMFRGGDSAVSYEGLSESARNRNEPEASDDHVAEAIERERHDINRQEVEYALSCLPDRHAEIIRLRFREEKTLREIADQIGVTKERVRQIEALAIEKMKEFLRTNPFQLRKESVMETSSPVSILEAIGNLTEGELDGEIGKLERQLAEIESGFKSRIKKLRTLRKSLFGATPRATKPKATGPRQSGPREGSTVKIVMDWLTINGPSRPKEIIKGTGLQDRQVSGCLSSYRGRYFERTEDGLWRAIGESASSAA